MRTLGRWRPRETAAVSLTDAELRVLAELAENLTYSQTASELYVSLNTIKTHVRSIYLKLGSGSREEAVAAARGRGLL